MKIIIWCKCWFTGKNFPIEVISTGKTEYFVENWEIEHPQYEVVGWDYV